jgi:predicted trehalose synthase
LSAQHTVFQCSVSQDAATPVTAGTTAATGTVVATSTVVAPTPTKVAQEPLQICNGTRDQTSIVFANRGTTTSLQQFLQNLQPNVDWMPAK